jgi:hypothetical protein
MRPARPAADSELLELFACSTYPGRAIATLALLWLRRRVAAPAGSARPARRLQSWHVPLQHGGGPRGHPLVARGYRRATPTLVRRGLANFIDLPQVIVADVQGKLGDGGRDLVRFTGNSLFGLGFFDPATRRGSRPTTRISARR